MWAEIILAFIVIVAFAEWYERRRVPIPSPFGPYLIGGTFPPLIISFVRGKFLEKLTDSYMMYGKTFQFKHFKERLVYISDSADLKHYFIDNFQNYVKPSGFVESLQDIFGDGIFNVHGDKWKVQRQVAAPLFHFNNLHAFAEIFRTKSEALCEILEGEAASGAGPVEMQARWMTYTMDSIGELGFGVDVGSIKGNQRAADFCEAFDYCQQASYLRVFNPLWKVTPHHNFNAKLRILDDYMKEIIADRRQEMADGQDVSGRVDLLSRFISAKDDQGNPTFDDKYLLDVLKNFLIAGRDTTAVCLTWTLYLISQHPDVEKRLLDEINMVVGKDGKVEYAHLAELKYMRQVIDESLRLYPPVPVDARAAVNDDILPGTGYHIPAGTVVLYAPYAQHRFPEYFKDPLTFNPDRWVTDYIKPFAFIPFHCGPRICLGQNMAYQEIKIALATILPKFSFKLLEGFQVRYRLAIVMPTKGLPMWVTKRKME